MPNFTCNICKESFPTRNKRDAHKKRVCQETGTVVDSLGVEIKPTRQNGKFYCHCSSHPSSPKGYATIDGLQKHLNKVKAPWISPEDAAIHSVPPTEPEPVRDDNAMESLNTQEQHQKQGEESYPLQLSSDVVGCEEESGGAADNGKGKGKAVEDLQGEEGEEESDEDGHDRGKGQVILGQQKVQGPSSFLSSSIAVRYEEEEEEGSSEEYDRGKSQVVESQQEVQGPCPSKFSFDAVGCEGEGSEAEGHDIRRGPVVEDSQEEQESYTTHSSPIASNFGQENDESHPVDSHTASFGWKGKRKFVVVEEEDEHESDEGEDGEDGEDEEIWEEEEEEQEEQEEQEEAEEAEEQEEAEEEQEAEEPPSGLIFHPYLSSLNFAVNWKYKFLICEVCKEAVEKKEIEGHLKQTHKNGIFKVDSTHLAKVVEKLKVVSPLPGIKGPCSPVKGLPVVDAHACHLCSAVFTSQKNIQSHYTDYHKGSPKDWHRCKAQRLRTQGFGPYRRLWEVNVEPMQERKYLHQDLVNKLLEDVEKDLRVVVVPSDARMVSPLLLKTGWHKYVANNSLAKNISGRRKSVSLPTAEEAQWKGIRGATEAYFKKAVDLIDNTDTLVLKHLNSPDPVKQLHASELFGPYEEIRESILKLQTMLEDDEEQDMVVMQIHSVLLGLWTIDWNKRDCGELPIADPTEHCLALLMLKESGAFKEPKDLTSLISKFEYCIRLTFLCEIHDRVNQKKGDREEACTELQHWFTENNYSTFASLRSLQHMASAMAYDTPGLPRILWADTENWRSLYYKGNPITFDEICLIFKETGKKLIETWEEKVLGGVSLSIPCKAIVDNLTNKDVGYSFIFDPKNTAFNKRTHLIHEVIEGKGKFEGFVVVREGSLRWNVGALRGWLKDYAELHKLLLLRAAMLSGAPARGSEMTAMTYRNTQTRPMRNLMCMGGHIALVCQYSKTTSLTGQDKFIPHGLDAITSDILLQDLALARPFAEIAAAKCFGDPVAQLYKDHLFLNYNRLFTSDDLSKVMAHHSAHLSAPLSINSWRHIQTAWKRKFKCSEREVMEIDQAEDADALQAGHLRSTENRIYGISTTALAGAAEDVLPLYLHASTTWQKHCKVVPGGKLLPYHEVHFEAAQPSTEHAINMDDLAQRVATHLAPQSSTSAALPLTASLDMDDLAKRVAVHLAPMLANMVDNTVKTVVSSLIQK
ncbi:hypothetical protein EDD15DRAFT_2479439 [Pisolithus albus]|nr:hypothetical protein EDD15DRAFT_2479439 [Pisolithus albus]